MIRMCAWMVLLGLMCMVDKLQTKCDTSSIHRCNDCMTLCVTHCKKNGTGKHSIGYFMTIGKVVNVETKRELWKRNQVSKTQLT